MNKIIALSGALLCVCLPARAESLLIAGGHVAALSPASLTPFSHARHHDRRQHHRVEIAPAIDARAAGRPLGGRPLLAIARRYLGVGKFTRFPGPWCRDAINDWARQVGIRLANTSRLAIDALGLGRHVLAPQPGDLVVMRHHVTIFAGHRGGRILGLGGNQDHSVNIKAYPAGRVLAFVRL